MSKYSCEQFQRGKPQPSESCTKCGVPLYAHKEPMKNTDNPPYITIKCLNDVWYAVKMEWNSRDDGYIVSEGRRRHNQEEAAAEAIKWATVEELEQR